MGFPMVRSLLFLARNLCLYMLVGSRDRLSLFHHDAELRLILGRLQQNPKNQGPTVFGCGSAATLILRILDI